MLLNVTLIVLLECMWILFWRYRCRLTWKAKKHQMCPYGRWSPEAVEHILFYYINCSLTSISTIKQNVIWCRPECQNRFHLIVKWYGITGIYNTVIVRFSNKVRSLTACNLYLHNRYLDHCSRGLHLLMLLNMPQM